MAIGKQLLLALKKNSTIQDLDLKDNNIDLRLLDEIESQLLLNRNHRKESIMPLLKQEK